MSVSTSSLVPPAALLAAVAALAGPGGAQVPEGSAVVATTYAPNAPGTPGLFLVPLAGGPAMPVNGLPAELQHTGGGNFPHGTSSVSYRSSDGAIIIGTETAANGPTLGAIHLFVLFLNGDTVDPVRSRQILLGNTANVGGAYTTVLSDDRILVAAGQQGGFLSAGPMAGHLLAIVDLSGPAPVFTLLPNPNVPGVIGGIAVDPTARFVYIPFTVNINSPARVAELHRFDLATLQQCTVASWPGHVANGLVCDDDGMVYVSTTDAAAITHHVQTVHINGTGCNPTAGTSTRSSLSLLPSGLDLDRASGRFAAASGPARPGYTGPQLNALSLIDPVTGTATVVASPPSGGWGVIARDGLAVNNVIESYGAPTDGQSRYWFDNFPNPGGQPTVGNTGFSLTMASSPGTAMASALALSFGRGSTTILGAEVLVDLGSTVVELVPPGPSVPYPLPVPASPSLSGLVLTAQSLHLEAGNGLASSHGLSLTVQ